MHNKEKKISSEHFFKYVGAFFEAVLINICLPLPIMVVPIILFYNNFLQNLNIIWRVIFLMHQVALHSQRTIEPRLFSSCNLNIIKYRTRATTTRS